MKTAIYESLHLINAANQQIAEHLDRLKTEKLLEADFVEAHKAIIEEKIASINIAVVTRVEPQEHKRSVRLARIWDKWVKYLEG